MEFLIFSSALLIMKSLGLKEIHKISILFLPLGAVMFFLAIRFFMGGFETLLHFIVSIIVAFVFIYEGISKFYKVDNEHIGTAQRVLNGFSLPIGILGIIIGFIGLFFTI